MVKELKTDIKLNFKIAKREIIMGEMKAQKEVLRRLEENDKRVEEMHKGVEEW
jgi:hypothetical protein